MRRAATRLSAVAFLLTAGALLSISVAAGSPSANSTSFDDPAGDGKEGGDVTRVRAITQDDGALVFELTVPNRQSLLGAESIQLFIDADRSASTGSANGADFAMSIFARSGRVLIDKWQSGSWARQRQSLESGFTPRTLTLRARQTEFALSGWFDFWIASYSTYSDSSAILADRAPDSGRWRHSLTPGGGPPATTAPPVTVDTDRDGVLDSADRCVRQKGGPYDWNRNGCPGPFKTMSLKLSYPSRTSANYTWWSSDRPPVLSGAAPQAKVSVNDGTRSETGRADARGRYQSRLLIAWQYPLGTIITFKTLRPGWIGAHWEIKILNRSPGWKVHRRLCIPTAGGAPRACGRVERGS